MSTCVAVGSSRLRCSNPKSGIENKNEKMVRDGDKLTMGQNGNRALEDRVCVVFPLLLQGFSKDISI